MAENLNLRVVPELSFTIDESERRAAQIDNILDALATQPAAVTADIADDDEHAD
jgi:ribosome-binding factor A